MNSGFEIKLSTVYLLVVFVFSLSSFYFYEPSFFDEQIVKFFYWCFIIVLFGWSFKSLLYTSEDLQFASLLRLLLFSMFFSTVPSLFTWGQNPILSLRALFPYLGFILYFFLLTTKPALKWLVKIIWILSILYILVYIFSLIQAPDTFFGSFVDKDVENKRGLFRLFIPGRGFLFLTFFIAVTNYLHLKKAKWLWIALGLFLIIVAHVIRQYIFFSFVIAGWVFLLKIPVWKKTFFLFLGVLVVYYTYEHSLVFQTLIELTENQFVEGHSEENIRITAYRFFFFEFSPNALSAFFGNGIPHASSDYGLYYVNVINEQKYLYLSDVGYAQIYALFGVPGLIAVFLIFIRVFFVKIPLEFFYLKLFIIFVFFANFMSGYFLSNHNIAAISIVLFMIEVVAKQKDKVLISKTCCPDKK